MKKGVNPIFHRAYELPYSLKPKVEEEISKLVKDGVLTKVTHSDWASPIVVVPKKNNTDIRLCVDLIFACLSGNKVFCVIDLKEHINSY